jgi:hypothetical protein
MRAILRIRPRSYCPTWERGRIAIGDRPLRSETVASLVKTVT